MICFVFLVSAKVQIPPTAEAASYATAPVLAEPVLVPSPPKPVARLFSAAGTHQ